eukprot:5787232-Amphidinium_carterae.1
MMYGPKTDCIHTRTHIYTKPGARLSAAGVEALPVAPPEGGETAGPVTLATAAAKPAKLYFPFTLPEPLEDVVPIGRVLPGTPFLSRALQVPQPPVP